MTTLVKRVVREKRSLIIPLAIALLLNIVAYVFVVRPRGVQAAGVADRATAAAADLRTAEREFAGAQALVSGKAQADDELNAFYGKVLPASQDAARRMTYGLQALATKNSVRWARIASEYDEKTRTGDDLGHLTLSMVLSGEYRDLRAFMYALESAPDFFIIDEVQLTEAKANEPLALVIRFSTYFRLSANGA